MRPMTFLICFLFILNTSTGQSVRDNFFFKFGAQGGYFIMPSYDRTPAQGGFAEQYVFSELDIVFAVRYNIKKINENQSIGLFLETSAGVFMGGGAISVSSPRRDESILTVNFPIGVSYNVGAGSTYTSGKPMGVSVKAGLDVNLLYPIRAKGNTFYDDFKKSYLLPFIGIDYLYLNKKEDYVYDVYLRYEFGFNKHTATVLPDTEIKTPRGIKVGIVIFLGY